MVIGCFEILIIICNNENVFFDKVYMVLFGIYIKIWILKLFWIKNIYVWI